MAILRKPQIEKIGNGNQQLVLLHGWGWHSAIWQPILHHFAQAFTVHLIDLPGFGKNALQPFSYTLENTLELLLDLTPRKRSMARLVMGGMLAWQIAIRYPERVSHLITFASSPKFLTTDNWPGVPPETMNQFTAALTHDLQRTLNRFFCLAITRQ